MGTMWFSRRKSEKISDYFSEESLRKIKAYIRHAERYTSGEIRVKIRMQFDEDITNVHDQALRDFAQEGLHNTRDKTGALILVVLGRRAFKILADAGICAKLPQEYWDNHTKNLVYHFRNGNYAWGICAVVTDVGEKLSTFFPRKQDATNELSDDVIVEDGR